jgi:hypothetical protein
MRHTMHLRPGVAKQPNLELKTWPKQLLGSLPLVFALPGLSQTNLSSLGHYKSVLQMGMPERGSNGKARSNVNNCWNANIYYYLETYGGQSSNLYLNVHFFNSRAN